MTVELKAIHIYSYDGQIRSIAFHSGLNIITGKSKTGKSAIIDIVDYCLGRGSCYIAEGIIRQKVLWFAVDILSGDDHLFVARKNPGPSIETSKDIYIRRGAFAASPKLDEIVKNITLEALVRLLTRFSGIAENENRPISGTRRPLQATIRHALFLCFQKQDEIDNRDRLFHRQGEDFIPQSIKDTVPYFLGAVDEDQFVKQYELDLAREELRALENSAAQRVAYRRSSRVTTTRLLNEGKRIGIVPADFQPVDEQDEMAGLERAAKVEITSSQYVPDFGETISRLRDEQKGLREALTAKTEEIRVARMFQSDQTAFSREGVEQRARLSSLGLYKSKEDPSGENCPVCDSRLAVHTPTVDILRGSLDGLNRQLAVVYSESPHLQEHIAGLERARERLEIKLVEAQANLTKTLVDDAKAQAEQDMLLDRARVVGRISAYLETVRPEEGDEALRLSIDTARRKVQTLEVAVAAEDVAQRTDTYLNLVSNKMAEYSKRLDLEHGSGALRLDLKKLTVVADTETGPIPLYRMGSGENWVGYHVLTYLALHWWFRKRDRPVPGFVFFDQPSQAHYPAERDQDGKLDPLNDHDRTAVSALFKLMDDGCNEIAQGFQLIVLDHAHMNEDWFEKAIIDEWRQDRALVPAIWPNGPSRSA